MGYSAKELYPIASLPMSFRSGCHCFWVLPAETKHVLAGIQGSKSIHRIRSHSKKRNWRLQEKPLEALLKVSLRASRKHTLGFEKIHSIEAFI
jgi:hypothetical protein